MSAAKRFWPKTRLKTLVSLPGGLSASEAVARAEVGLESVSTACLAAVDDKIDRLVALSAQRGDVANRQDVIDRIYRLSNEVFAESGAFGRAAVSMAAQSLCDLTSGANGQDNDIWNGIEVHVQSMRLLRQGDVESSDEMCRAVLEGLRKVSRRSMRAG
jgi:hypothetical protein